MSGDHGLVPSLRRPGVEDVAASAARFERRVLEREGIPMVLALSDARTGAPPVVDDPVALAEAPRLVELFDHYDAGSRSAIAALEASDEPDLTGGAPLIAVLVVLAEEHLRVDVPDEPDEDHR